MKMYFRFFLSHDNSEKNINISWKKYVFWENSAMKRRALRDVIMLVFMTKLATERETAVKSVM